MEPEKSRNPDVSPCLSEVGPDVGPGASATDTGTGPGAVPSVSTTEDDSGTVETPNRADKLPSRAVRIETQGPRVVQSELPNTQSSPRVEQIVADTPGDAEFVGGEQKITELPNRPSDIVPNSKERYLSETINNELLLIYQIQGNDGEDVIEGNVVDEEGNNNIGEGDENDMEGNEQNENVLGWVGQFLRKALHLKSSSNDDNVYLRTRCFTVYKLDPDNSKFRRVQDLGDQILFLAEDNSSLSLLASDFKDLRGNCIYFATRGKEYATIGDRHFLLRYWKN
ncbi:hypothetical protein ACLB2K_016346 [Fragaria x ananassa]